jgi:hypothetical protein
MRPRRKAASGSALAMRGGAVVTEHYMNCGRGFVKEKRVFGGR